MQATNDVTINHAISTGNLNITGQDATIAAAIASQDENLNMTGNTVITSAGSIGATGHHVSVTAHGGIDVAGAITANDSDFIRPGILPWKIRDH